jgi:hypothetical protein
MKRLVNHILSLFLFLPPAAFAATAFETLSGASPAPAFSAALPDPAPAEAKYAESAVSYTARHARRLAALAGRLTQVNFTDGGMNGQDKYFYWGAPAIVRQVTPAQTGLMRHWTSNGAVDGVPVVDLIVKSGLMKAGPRVYIVPESHRADYYQDLHGVFFTTPEFRPGDLWMGLQPDSDYVDFVVDRGMGALYLAPGNYLFPCPLKLPGWLADEYKKWKASGGPMPSGMEFTFNQIEREGGLQDAIDIPVTVVRYQKNGRVTVLRPDLLKKPY